MFRRWMMFSVGLGALLMAVLGDGAPALADTASFTTQGCTTWSVPAGVSSVVIQATGSAGQTFSPSVGTGDVVSGTLSGLATGQTLDVCVDYGGGSGGVGFGGLNGGNGGGASGVAFGSDFTTPVLVAGGGGGEGPTRGQGGAAGVPAGSTGGAGDNSNPGTGGNNTTMMGGAGGTAPSGGSGLPGTAFSSSGPGTGGQGGNTSLANNAGGGGGGGGYYGGGGGGAGEGLGSASGGGGGSDFCAPSLTAPLSLSGCGVTGQNSTYGTASVVFSYTFGPDFADLLADSQGVRPGTSLADKVASAQSSFNAGDKADACGTLSAYVHEVKAQTGKSITSSQATDLIGDANAARTVIGCTSP